MRLLSKDSTDMTNLGVPTHQPSRGTQSALSNVHTEGPSRPIKRPNALSGDHLDQIGTNDAFKEPPTSLLRNHMLQRPPSHYKSVFGKFKRPERMMYEGDGGADEMESNSNA